VITPDTSVAIAAATSWHEAHPAAVAALAETEIRLIAHVAFETTAALSRMPEGHRVAPDVVREWLELRFPDPWLALDAAAARQALADAVAGGVRGGALYDALIGSTARHHGAALVSADRRAARAYRAVGVDVRLVGGA
jgi:predicted nucleic acid-binding protein